MNVRAMRDVRRVAADGRFEVHWGAAGPGPSFEVSFLGPEGSPYGGLELRAAVTVPESSPLAPPTLRMRTPVLHPNIDRGGVVCLGVLALPPAGQWTPAASGPAAPPALGG